MVTYISAFILPENGEFVSLNAGFTATHSSIMERAAAFPDACLEVAWYVRCSCVL
jgi:hypothetical protein